MATAIESNATSTTRNGRSAADEPDKPSSKKKFVLPIAIVVGLVLLFWGFQRWNYGRSHESTDNAQVDGHIVPVLAKVGGYVKSVNVSENDHVNAGQLLVQLDDADYRVRLQQAQADLAAAEATSGGGGFSGQAQSQVQSAAGQRATLDAQIGAARANANKADADLARAKELASKLIISNQQLDAAQATAAVAHANLLAAERQAAAAGGTVNTAEAGVRVASARTMAARAAAENAQLQLDYTRITAPASGEVSRKQVEVGQLVAPGQPLLSIVADTGIWVTANFKETQLATIRPGQPVEFEIDAYGGCVGEGKVASVSGATGAKFALLPPDNATGNFTKVVQRVPVRIAVTKPCSGNHALRPGLSANVHVNTANR
ncbi:MAG: rane fusion protein multidrug efflux system [Gemmatimonadaceae bacterium]|jgi:membrane fusion protein (multidrug efflux system)|nr:rane fusion protein multidrug efflux system [Gemmatimonadaceae bacterium]